MRVAGEYLSEERNGHGVRPRKNERSEHGNQMQTLRIEHVWTRMPVWTGGNARTQGRRRPLRLVRIEHVRTRMSIRAGWNPPARNREPVHLVRVDDDGNGVPIQPDKKAREISGRRDKNPFCRWRPAGAGNGGEATNEATASEG